ncbi:hypothetical protein GCM10007320_08650 [Pseudorhodoferax aquiterrae]|uniref:Uncharacterized protein n=1 Tax=Pseudorhodoferax aquiterrae TaxID=747304 RepID=A0ABQ3FWJ2_9BURK|nr:DUF6682 family protein [Pseudorhodoferax aquiterrae]GHC72640.1 hypothetical protein GCM10007320_08650 [Pseudorhodoferax aquiterrae]
MLASHVIAEAAKLLNDLGHVRWSLADKLSWLNAGQRQIVAVRPDANAVKADRALVAGVEQSLPAGGTKLLDVIRNVGGRAVTLISRDQMTALNAGWFEARPSRVIQHYFFDANDPKSFLVYPPAETGAAVRILYAALPHDCTDADDSAIALDDIYEGPLIDWICYRAWSVDGDAPGDAGRAANALSTFMQALGVKTQADQSTQPRRA